MDHTTHNRIVGFIWSIADDVLRDVFVRGKYRDVILPMTVIRRLDALLEPSKEAVLEQKKMLDGAGIVNQDEPLKAAAGQAFFNTSSGFAQKVHKKSLLHKKSGGCTKSLTF